MRAFDLDLYNQLVKEGKTPKVVTRDGRDVRILCTDKMDIQYPIVALVKESEEEIARIYPADGKYISYEAGDLDLFFADIEPTYRPYKDAEECFKDVVKHGGWVKGIEPECIGYHHIQSVSCGGVETYPLAPSYEYMLKVFVWADTGEKCGVKED